MDLLKRLIIVVNLVFVIKRADLTTCNKNRQHGRLVKEVCTYNKKGEGGSKIKKDQQRA